jgi:hypothetical protein
LNVIGVDRAKQPPNTGKRMKKIYPPDTSSCRFLENQAGCGVKTTCWW